MSKLSEGDMAPDFTLPRDGGGMVNLCDLRGTPVVLFFYPRDDTPGCTTEALDFTNAQPEFERLGAAVLGVSKDPVAKHEKFRDKHQLAIPLLSDAESDICEQYGVWVEKKMYGKSFLGIERTSFLIDAEGRIARIWSKVKVAGHVEEVLQALRD